jgi:hypothetical protein
VIESWHNAIGTSGAKLCCWNTIISHLPSVMKEISFK